VLDEVPAQYKPTVLLFVLIALLTKSSETAGMTDCSVAVHQHKTLDAVKAAS